MKYEELKDEIKAAMKAHDNVRRDILRQVHGEIKNIEVNERREVTDADVDAMLKRVIKQTSETLEGSIKAANNDERTAMLKEQVEILEGYLPKQLAGDELVALVEKTIADPWRHHQARNGQGYGRAYRCHRRKLRQGSGRQGSWQPSVVAGAQHHRTEF